MLTSREARHENVIWSGFAVFIAALGSASAGEGPGCEIPGYLVSGVNDLKRVSSVVKEDRKLSITVVGTGSSALARPDGPHSASPARLEAVLRKRLPGVAVNVTTLSPLRARTQRTWRTAWGNCFCKKSPDLVIWQTGTMDAGCGR